MKKSRKQAKQLPKNQKIAVIIGSVVLVWMALLSLFIFDLYVMHEGQSKYDSEALYQLMIQNSQQQEEIDTLKKQ